MSKTKELAKGKSNKKQDEQLKQEKIEKAKKGLRITRIVFNVLLSIFGLVASALIIYVFVASGMAIHDAWAQIFG